MSQAQAIARVRFFHNVIDPLTGMVTRQEFASPLYRIERKDGIFSIAGSNGVTVRIQADASWVEVETVPALDDTTDTTEITNVEKPKKRGTK